MVKFNTVYGKTDRNFPRSKNLSGFLCVAGMENPNAEAKAESSAEAIAGVTEDTGKIKITGIQVFS